MDEYWFVIEKLILLLKEYGIDVVVCNMFCIEDCVKVVVIIVKIFKDIESESKGKELVLGKIFDFLDVDQMDVFGENNEDNEDYEIFLLLDNYKFIKLELYSKYKYDNNDSDDLDNFELLEIIFDDIENDKVVLDFDVFDNVVLELLIVDYEKRKMIEDGFLDILILLKMSLEEVLEELDSMEDEVGGMIEDVLFEMIKSELIESLKSEYRLYNCLYDFIGLIDQVEVYIKWFIKIFFDIDLGGYLISCYCIVFEGN